MSAAIGGVATGMAGAALGGVAGMGATGAATPANAAPAVVGNPAVNQAAQIHMQVDRMLASLGQGLADNAVLRLALVLLLTQALQGREEQPESRDAAAGLLALAAQRPAGLEGGPAAMSQAQATPDAAAIYSAMAVQGTGSPAAIAAQAGGALGAVGGMVNLTA